jgi:hypothetical protein
MNRRTAQSGVGESETGAFDCLPSKATDQMPSALAVQPEIATLDILKRSGQPEKSLLKLSLNNSTSAFLRILFLSTFWR